MNLNQPDMKIKQTWIKINQIWINRHKIKTNTTKNIGLIVSPFNGMLITTDQGNSCIRQGFFFFQFQKTNELKSNKTWKQNIIDK